MTVPQQQRWREVGRTLRRLFWSYTARRLLKAFLTILLVVSLTFFLVRLMPGNPVEVYIHTLNFPIRLYLR